MTEPILLVEDNAADITLTEMAFEESKVANPLVVARDGKEALDLLYGPSPIRPQLVLLDLKLPKIDGLEVLQRIRAEPSTKLLPVIILTSSAEEQDLINGYSFGANSYIRKPVDFSQFVGAVKQLGLYWLVLNQPPPIRVGK